jgi:hypothetical protein
MAPLSGLTMRPNGAELEACHLAPCGRADVYAADVAGTCSAYPTGENWCPYN